MSNMVKNHEIRFKCERELTEKSETIWKSVCNDLKKTAFYKNVFVLGLSEIQKQTINQKPNIASNLIKQGGNK